MLAIKIIICLLVILCIVSVVQAVIVNRKARDIYGEVNYLAHHMENTDKILEDIVHKLH